jgi:hypothetical protein
VRSTWVKHELVYALQGKQISGKNHPCPLQAMRQRCAVVDPFVIRMDRFPPRL